MTPAQLRAWREHWMFTQAEMAGMLGIHFETYGAWERGRQAIPPFLELALETLARRRAADLVQRAASLPGDRAGSMA